MKSLRPACRLLALLGIGVGVLAAPALADCPEYLGSVDTPEDAINVAVAGGYAYVADREAGLRVIDVSTPSTPVEVGFLDTPGYTVGVAVAGGYAYVADLYAGLAVFEDCSLPFSDGFESGDTSAWSATVP